LDQTRPARGAGLIIDISKLHYTWSRHCEHPKGHKLREAIQSCRPQAGLLRLRLAMTATENVMISGNLNNLAKRIASR
jgi:hypothetical protein